MRPRIARARVLHLVAAVAVLASFTGCELDAGLVLNTEISIKREGQATKVMMANCGGGGRSAIDNVLIYSEPRDDGGYDMIYEIGPEGASAVDLLEPGGSFGSSAEQIIVIEFDEELFDAGEEQGYAWVAEDGAAYYAKSWGALSCEAKLSTH